MARSIMARKYSQVAPQEDGKDGTSASDQRKRKKSRISGDKINALRDVGRQSTETRGNLYQGRLSLQKALRRGTLNDPDKQKHKTSTMKEIQPGLRRLTTGKDSPLPKAKQTMLPNIFVDMNVPERRGISKNDYPPVLPPVIPKKTIFSSSRYAGLDNYVSKVPTIALYGDFYEVAKFLTKTCRSDVEKVRALFSWTASIDVTTLQQSLEKIPDSGTPLDYLLHVNWKMGNHPLFFAKLCRAANIPAMVVCGMCKNAAYEIGGKVDRSTMASQWNAVYIAGEWRFVDVFWGSRCIVDPRSAEWVEIGKIGIPDNLDGEHIEGQIKRYRNDAYFLTDPDELIKTHFPDDSGWQLLSEPHSMQEFEKGPYIRERFHQLGMRLVKKSHPECLAKAKGGKIEFVFGIPEDKSKDLQFKYLLFRQTKDDALADVRLDQYVFYQKTSDVVKFHISFPVAGFFKLHIYGVDEKRDANHDLCVVYLVQCDDPLKHVSPLPDIPDIGWGPGVEAEVVGLTPATHEEAVIEVTDGNLEIRFDISNPVTVLHDMKNNEGNQLRIQTNAMIHVENEEVIMNLRLPKFGDYALEIHAAEANVEGDIPNVCNYLIKCSQDNEMELFPRVHEGQLGRGLMAEEFKVYPKSHPENVINTETESISIEFEIRALSDEDINETELCCELQNNDCNGQELATCVSYTNNGIIHVFDLTIPRAGEYAMNVFAKKIGDTGEVCHVHTYMIVSTQQQEAQPSKVASKKKQADLFYKLIETKKERKKIRTPASDKPHVAEIFKTKCTDVAKFEIKGYRVANVNFFEAELPDVGEYKLHVFEENNNSLVVVDAYKIIRHSYDSPHIINESMASLALLSRVTSRPTSGQKPESKPESQPEQHQELSEIESQRLVTAEEDRIIEEELRMSKEDARIEEEENNEKKKELCKQKLQAAITGNNLAELEAAIKCFEQTGIEQGELHAKAIAELKAKPIKEVLASAINKRCLPDLNESIQRADDEGLEEHLGLQYQIACKIRDQLDLIETVKREVRDLDNKTIAEIKSYSTPPQAVHFVMSAALMVLGEQEKSVRDWRSVVVAMAKTGKESFKKRIMDFDVSTLKIDIAMKANMMLNQFTFEALQDISEGAATVYKWTSAVIDECQSRYESNGGDLNAISIGSKAGKSSKKQGHK